MKKTSNPHLASQTSLTRTGQPSGWNGKPYRTKAMKKLAREKAYKTKDGHFQSPVPVLYHTAAS